jgi:outer membrane protease
MRNIFFILVIVITFASVGVSEGAEGYVTTGIGKLQGDTTYRIGGKVYGPGSGFGAGEVGFPISELEFDIDIYMVSLGGGVKFAKDWDFSLIVKKSFTNGNGVLKDSDYSGYSIPEIYSESDAQLDAWSADVNLHYRFLEGLYAGIGYLYQNFDYDVRDFRQWYPLWDYAYGTSIGGVYGPGLGLTYDVRYHIPYLELGAKGHISDEISIDTNIRYSPLVVAKDRDNHVARAIYHAGDCKGHAFLWTLKGQYDFPQNWFMTVEFDYTRINTSGESKSYINEEWQWTIDQETESTQIYFSFMAGYRF